MAIFTNIVSLRTLLNAFRRFSQNTSERLNALEFELKRVLESVQNQISILRRQVEEKKWKIQEARRALEYCRSQEDEDYTPDCSDEAFALEHAMRGFARAKENLQRGKIFQIKVENTIFEFHAHIRRLKTLATSKAGKANTYLKNKIVEIEDYQAVRLETGSIFVPLSESVTPSQSHAVTEAQTSHMADNHPSVSSNWVAKRVSDFDLSNIPSPEGIKGESDFQKVTLEEMRKGLKRLQEMKPAIEKGIGHHKDYWADFDKEKGFDYPNGYQRVYEAFYGAEPIRIEKIDGKYEFVNGRHRVWAAKQLGIKTLPVVLVERHT